jgi:hypothetical protein
LGLDGFDDIKEGDIIECYSIQVKQGELWCNCTKQYPCIMH